ncbi:galactokinase [Macrococcus lamae]|uniref:Galactokinase n=1 Tax=Macrococcus lamae TaxID=198484 RepID=A0A4R6BS59_9STAP|nr:galactokinase [Macrococcus lamae]TDM05238.1 galactokinase [Macrococcus lamae]
MKSSELEQLKASFNTVFGQAPEELYFAPGRINLIGEHLDYNDGHVFPAAISFGTYAAVGKRNDTSFNVYSLNFAEEGTYSLSLDELNFAQQDKWSNYVKGVLKYTQDADSPISHGLNIAVYGNIPNGAGLSSSASLELLIGTILNDAYQLNKEPVDLIKIGQKVENDFIGLNSGIMDQFAIGMGKSEHAILLDCKDLTYEYAPLHLNDYQLVIINSNKRRELSDSKYNERRSECEQALQDLQTVKDIDSLCALSVEEFEELKHVITNPIHQRRAKHVVYENERTLTALEALKEDDLLTFGRLMNESHESLKNDYDVTGIELDTIADSAQSLDSVIGARMTGAGFGGCAIALVQKDEINSFKQYVAEEYTKKIGYAPDFYEVNISDGPKKIKELV